MKFQEIRQQLQQYKDDGKKVFTTSSFQTHSLVLLHMISRVNKDIPVYFINTGYHFPETVAFAEQICGLLELKLVRLNSLVPKHQQRDDQGNLLFTSDPDYCCFLNKTQPLEMVLRDYDVWINGVRAEQSRVRKAMKVHQEAPHGVVRFHPMLDWNIRDVFAYLKEHNLPRHPLDAQGYASIGCEPCTKKPDPGLQEREARWYGMNKTECGLNTDLAKS